MIKIESFINENKLGKQIIGEGNHIVNLEENYFQYCNGFVIVNCTYNLDLVIQKLFKIGAISNYKNWKVKKTFDFTDILSCKKEVEATQTLYLKKSNNSLVSIFKIGNKFFSYKKEFVDIFKNATFKADDSLLPNLRVYGNGEFIGLILPIRDNNEILEEIIGN